MAGEGQKKAPPTSGISQGHRKCVLEEEIPGHVKPLFVENKNFQEIKSGGIFFLISRIKGDAYHQLGL